MWPQGNDAGMGRRLDRLVSRWINQCNNPPLLASSPPPSHFPQADRPQASSGEQAASLKESWQIDEGAEALAAERLQRWWRAERRVGRTAAALLAQAEQLERYERMIV